MKKNVLIKVIALSAITMTLIQATNGDHLINVGAKARGMGGVGIAMHHGAESTLSNPAGITSIENTEISFGGTLFMPDIQTRLNVNSLSGLPPQKKMSSDADLNMIPEVSLGMKINENFYIGIGMWGTAGMGVDYSQALGIQNTLAKGQFSNFNMVTNLQLMQFAIPFAYKTNGLSIAVAPVLQYGNLDINYAMPTGKKNPMTASFGAGLAQDFGVGYNLGISWDTFTGLVMGVEYKSKIDMKYANQLSTATKPFGITLPDNNHLEQPEEIGIGFAYTQNQHTIAFDYKRLNWSDAKGYQDFQWEDQDIYAVGYEYNEVNWAFRVGYNQSSSAVVETMNPAINMFNLLGFPATAEKHYTVGGSYAFNSQFSLDLAYVYTKNASKTFDVSALKMGIDSVKTDHKEESVSFQLNYKF